MATTTTTTTFSFFLLFFFLEQRAPRERAPSSELRLEGKGVKRTRETVVPFAMLKRKETLEKKELENAVDLKEMRNKNDWSEA